MMIIMMIRELPCFLKELISSIHPITQDFKKNLTNYYEEGFGFVVGI